MMQAKTGSEKCEKAEARGPKLDSELMRCRKQSGKSTRGALKCSRAPSRIRGQSGCENQHPGADVLYYEQYNVADIWYRDLVSVWYRVRLRKCRVVLYGRQYN